MQATSMVIFANPSWRNNLHTKKTDNVGRTGHTTQERETDEEWPMHGRTGTLVCVISMKTSGHVRGVC